MVNGAAPNTGTLLLTSRGPSSIGKRISGSAAHPASSAHMAFTASGAQAGIKGHVFARQKQLRNRRHRH